MAHRPSPLDGKGHRIRVQGVLFSKDGSRPHRTTRQRSDSTTQTPTVQHLQPDSSNEKIGTMQEVQPGQVSKPRLFLLNLNKAGPPLSTSPVFIQAADWSLLPKTTSPNFPSEVILAKPQFAQGTFLKKSETYFFSFLVLAYISRINCLFK